MKGIETGSGTGRKPRKAKRISPPKGKGPTAPKPSGVFADPVARQDVKPQPKAKAPAARKPARTVSALDTLPKAKGQPSKPYTPPAATKVVRKADRVRAKAQHEARDTKGDSERAQVEAYKRSDAYLQAVKDAAKGRQKPAEGLDVSNRLTKVLSLGTRKDRPRSDEEMRQFLATGQRPTRTGSKEALKASAQPVPVQLMRNAVEDYAEIITTTPSSLVKLGDTAVHDPKKVPGMLAAPYRELIKHPGKMITEHPVSTALMVAPIGKVPGRAAGRVARATGKQTLLRAPKTLAGTPLREQRVRSKNVVINARQARQDRRAGSAPEMSVADVQRRVDEFYDFAKQKRAQIEAGAHRTATQKHASLPKEQRKTAIEADVQGARAGAGKTIDQRFVKEFGSSWQRHSSGAIVKPKNATEGFLHASKADAEAVAAALKADPKITWEPQVMPAGSKWGVVPKDAKLRLNQHRAVGTSPATMAKVMRRSRGALTQAVLPLSTKWLLGQGVEAGVRSAVAGAGPADLLRFNRVVKTMNKAKAGSGDELLMRVTGGQFGLTGTAREFAQGQRSLADEFVGTSLEKAGAAATRAGNVLPARMVRKGWGKYTNVVLDSINGVMENTARKAMAGQHIKAGGLMDRRVVGLSERAIDDAAKGLTGTESQVALGRAVDRMYGQYQKFTPDKRSLLLHWTPFLPWYLNTAKFLFKVLPQDHPIKAALVADVGVATQEWREQNGLSLRGGDTLPSWMLGGFPTAKGMVPVGKFTPFGVGTDVPGAVASLTLPQFLGPIKNAAGVDWKWQPLKGPGYKGQPFTPAQKTLRALVTAAESQVPGVGPALRVSGVERRYVDHKTGGDSASQSVQRLLNPLAPIPNSRKATATKSRGGAARPPGVSQAELDQLVRDAQEAASQPSISQAEIDAILKASAGG